MISIILSWDKDLHQEAVAEGFRSVSVMVREEPTDGEQSRIEQRIRSIGARHFIVGDEWGNGEIR